MRKDKVFLFAPHFFMHQCWDHVLSFDDILFPKQKNVSEYYRVDDSVFSWDVLFVLFLKAERPFKYILQTVVAWINALIKLSDLLFFTFQLILGVFIQ